MKSYNSYHTCIKQLARSNMLPNKYADSIDRSTIWRWKQEKGNKYLGQELSNVQALQQFLERRESETLIRTYLKTSKNQVLYPCKSSELKLCIKRPPIPKKARYKTGIRATQPHQIWHADITIVKCLNGMKYYV